MKDTIKNIIDSDPTPNKSSTRYIYKNYPTIWKNILEKTSFLPKDAKPKQRIWHILNDVYYRPVCPITNEFVKWHENRYLTTANKSARTTLLNLVGKLKNQTTESKEKRKSSIQEGFKSGKIKPAVWTEEKIKNRYAKIEKACIEKYGVKSTLQLPSVRKKQYVSKCNSGKITPKEKKRQRQIYYEAVLKFTKESWKNHFDKINPNRLNRSEYNLDHIYSIQQGFRENIPPYIIGHWTNLRMLEPTKNYSKGMKCDKSKDMLFEDFFENIG